MPTQRNAVTDTNEDNATAKDVRQGRADTSSQGRTPTSETLVHRLPVRLLPRRDRFSKEQREWREQGRLLFFCSDSSGVGAYLLSLVTAVAASILTQRALILSSACRAHSAGEAIAQALGGYYEGNGFSWKEEVEEAARSPSTPSQRPRCARREEMCYVSQRPT